MAVNLVIERNCIIINGLYSNYKPLGAHFLLHTFSRKAKIKIKNNLFPVSHRKESIINRQEVPTAGRILQTTGWTENRKMWRLPQR